MSSFCRHLTNGLVYNNNIHSFTIAPCCYFKTIDTLSTDLSKYRKQWQNSNLTKNCRICLDIEKSGLASYRQASFDWLTGDENNTIEFLTIAVNKKCNLACVSCDANSSSFWFQENTRNKIVQSAKLQKMHAEDRQGDTTEKFLDLLKTQDLSNLKYIKFGGGEPLMTDTHNLVLDLIPYPEKVTLHYTSNFSLMPSKQSTEQWKKFKLVKWVASIDGVGEQFSFLRWPYKWSKLTEFVELAKQAVPGNVMFGVEHTLNPLNIFYFDQFQTWFEQNISTNRYGDRSDLNLHLCLGNLGIEQTPPQLRQLILDKFGAEHYLVQLLSKNPYIGHSRMVEYLDDLDLIRNQSWRETFSEVQGYFYV